MKIFYGISKIDLHRIKPILFNAGLPLIGYIPNKSPRKNGKFVAEYPDKHKIYLNEDKNMYPDGFYSVNGHMSVLYELRMQAANREPIDIRRII